MAIDVGWGIILYASIAIAVAFKLTFFAWISTVALFGLAIDFTMDVVAIRTGMWNWYVELVCGTGMWNWYVELVCGTGMPLTLLMAVFWVLQKIGLG